MTIKLLESKTSRIDIASMSIRLDLLSKRMNLYQGVAYSVTVITNVHAVPRLVATAEPDLAPMNHA